MDEEKFYQKIDIANLKHEKQTAGSRKISQAVFDDETMMSLYTLSKRGAFDDLEGILSTGKEAQVYLAKSGRKQVIAKIFLIETSDFRNMTNYIRGDPRFSVWKNRRQLIFMWAQKEYKNLCKVCDVIPCPKPIDVENNVLIMEFLGKDGVQAPRLRDCAPSDPKKYYEKVIGYVRKMYELRLVHADLSEFNILDWKGKPYIIDFSAGVLLDHPRSMEYLERDVQNVVNYFRKRGVDTDYNAAMKRILDEKADNKRSRP